MHWLIPILFSLSVVGAQEVNDTLSSSTAQPDFSQLAPRDEVKHYYAAAKNPDDEAGKNETRQFIEKLLPAGNLINDIWDYDYKVHGWGSLQLSDTGKTLVEKHEGVAQVLRDWPINRRKAIVKPSAPDYVQRVKDITALFRKRAVNFKRAITWYKQPLASWNLIATSQPPNTNRFDYHNYVYESHRGEGVYIYLVDAGVAGTVQNPSGNPEFPNVREMLQTPYSQFLGQDKDTDDDPKSHGTSVAAIARGQRYGVAKGATLVSVKTSDHVTDFAVGLFIAERDITPKPDRHYKSIVLCSGGDPNPSDPNGSLGQYPGASLAKDAIRRLFDLGVPVVLPAGNDRQSGRENIDWWPANFESPDFPIINVGATDDEGKRLPFSQGGAHLTTHAPGIQVRSLLKDGRFSDDTGTSMSAAAVAGVLATYMAYETVPWTNGLSGIGRVKAIRNFIKDDERAGWVRGPNAERVVWNGASKTDHENAQFEPGRPLNLPPVDCFSLEKNNPATESTLAANVDSFCKTAVTTSSSPQTYSVNHTYSEGQDNETNVRFVRNPYIVPDFGLCTANMGFLLDNCSHHNDIYGGGTLVNGPFAYSIEPTKPRPEQT